MNTKTPPPIQVPPPDEIRQELAAVVAEARALRQLLKLSEAAGRVQETRNARRPIRKEGRRDE